MKLALVGVGGAGSRIVNRIIEVEKETNRRFSDDNVLVFNTAPFEYDTSVRIESDNQYLIGDTHRIVEGEGVGGDVELAVDVTREELPDIRRAFDRLEVYNLDGVLLIAGMGGGTGCGMGSLLLEELTAMYDKPVYALGVLPRVEEGGIRALNAARAIRSFVPMADNLILFDNNEWHDRGNNTGSVSGEDSSEEIENSRTDPSIEEPKDYGDTNRIIATRITPLLAVGEYNSTDIGENVLDSSDLIRTMSTGGVSTIGTAGMEVSDGAGRFRLWLRHLLRRNSGRKSVDATDIDRLVKRAVQSRLSLPCEVASAERALIVLSGPEWALSRRGFESSRLWLEETAETVEILAGDEPLNNATEMTASVLLSNVTDVPRIEAIQSQAIEYQAAQSERTEAGGFTFKGRAP